MISVQAMIGRYLYGRFSKVLVFLNVVYNPIGVSSTGASSTGSTSTILYILIHNFIISWHSLHSTMLKKSSVASWTCHTLFDQALQVFSIFHQFNLFAATICIHLQESGTAEHQEHFDPFNFANGHIFIELFVNISCDFSVFKLELVLQYYMCCWCHLIDLLIIASFQLDNSYWLINYWLPVYNNGHELIIIRHG